LVAWRAGTPAGAPRGREPLRQREREEPLRRRGRQRGGERREVRVGRGRAERARDGVKEVDRVAGVVALGAGPVHQLLEGARAGLGEERRERRERGADRGIGVRRRGQLGLEAPQAADQHAGGRRGVGGERGNDVAEAAHKRGRPVGAVAPRGRERRAHGAVERRQRGGEPPRGRENRGDVRGGRAARRKRRQGAERRERGELHAAVRLLAAGRCLGSSEPVERVGVALPARAHHHAQVGDDRAVGLGRGVEELDDLGGGGGRGGRAGRGARVGARLRPRVRARLGGQPRGLMGVHGSFGAGFEGEDREIRFGDFGEGLGSSQGLARTPGRSTWPEAGSARRSSAAPTLGALSTVAEVVQGARGP
jgi:hypothetical protein